MNIKILFEFGFYGTRRFTLLLRNMLLCGITLLSSEGLAWPINIHDNVTLLRLGTGSETGVYFPLGTGLATIFNQQIIPQHCADSAPCKLVKTLALPQLSSGSKDNIESLARKSIEIGLAQADIAYGAYTGAANFGFDDAYACLRVLSNLYPEYLQIVVRQESDIFQLDDLRGLSIALDDPGSGTLLTARLVLRAAGLLESDFEPVYLKPELAAQAFADGELDALIMVIGAPARLISQLATTVPLRLLPISAEIATEVSTAHPYLLRDRLPDNVYPGVAGAETLTVAAQLLVHADLDEALVYRLSKILWQPSTYTRMARIRTGLYLGTENSLKGLGLPLHPGALRYLQDHNLFMDQIPQLPRPCPVNAYQKPSGLF